MGNSEQNSLWDAAEYSKINNIQTMHAKETLEQIAKDVPATKEMIMIDIGCGSGNITKMLSGSLLPKKVFALDADAGMIKFAAENSIDDKIEYLVQDISVNWDDLDERLKNLEGKVGLIFSNMCLHWVPDKATAVKTIARLLKPGGYAYINLALMWDLNEFAEDMEKKTLDKYFNFISRKQQADNWDSYFNNSHLSQLSTEYIDRSWIFDSAEQKDKMYGFIDSHLNKLAKNALHELPEAEKSALLNNMNNKYKESMQTPQGKNPKTDIDPNNLKMHYCCGKIIGKK